jgi:hypothetical protein
MEISVLEQRLRDDPDDLASWDAYGERLAERNDVRAELIRLERRRERVRPAGREAVEREIAALVGEHERAWDAELPPGATALERRYGFVTKVAVEWSDRAPVVIEQALRGPFVTVLRITAAREDDLEGGYDEDGWHEAVDEDGDPLPAPSVEAGALATLDVARLTELDLAYLRIGGLGAKALAVSAYLRAETPGALAAAGRMETLDLRYARVGDNGFAALAESPFFNGVRRLRLQNNAVTAKGAAALHRFERLTELDLRYNTIGAEGARALLAAPFAGSLRRLLLHRTDVGEDGAKLLAGASRLPPALRAFWRSV